MTCDTLCYCLVHTKVHIGTHRYSCTCAVLTSLVTGGCETFTNELSTTKSQGDGMNDWREGALNMMAVLHIHTENHDALLEFYSVHVHCGYINGINMYLHCTCTGENLYVTLRTLSKPYQL